MKNFVFLRDVDKRGRVTLPREVRKTLGLSGAGQLNLVVEKNGYVSISTSQHSLKKCVPREGWREQFRLAQIGKGE